MTKQAAPTSGPRLGTCRPAVNLLSRRKHINENRCFAGPQHISDMLVTNMMRGWTILMVRYHKLTQCYCLENPSISWEYDLEALLCRMP